MELSECTMNGSVELSTNASSCELYPTRQVYCDVLIYTKRTSASLSLIGCAFTACVIWLFRKYTEFSQRLILNLNVASVFIAVCYLFSDLSPPPGALCVVQGAWLTFAFWTVLMWVMTIVLNLYMNVILDKSLEKYERLIMVLCWGTPVIFAALPLAGGVYGRAGAWCWILNVGVWRYVIWYIWTLLSVVIMAVVVVYVSFVLYRNAGANISDMGEMGATRSRRLRDDALTLRIYPIVYFAVNLFPAINRIQNTVDEVNKETEYNFPLLLLQALSGPLLGVAVAVAFALDRRTIQFLRPSSVRYALRQRFARKTVIHELSVPVSGTSMEIGHGPSGSLD